jgi:hypothetical protein
LEVAKLRMFILGPGLSEARRWEAVRKEGERAMVREGLKLAGGLDYTTATSRWCTRRQVWMLILFSLA